MKQHEIYLHLAELFKYPDAESPQRVKKCQDILEVFYPDASLILRPFTDYFLSINEDKREELFTKTFDVQPICYLDLGYVIFGEDYKRGSFLLHMQQEQKNIGRDCHPELPDHLYHVLHLITIHPDKAFVDELVAMILVPAVKKMIQEFESARVELKIKVIKKLHNAIIDEEMNQGNVYKEAFKALLHVLESEYADAIQQYNPKEENLVNEAFFAKSNPVNQLVSNYKID